MTLGEFKKYIESFEEGYLFEYGISNPFSWRGIYAEVAFTIINEKTSKEDILEKINEALSNTFSGRKGGEYTYDENTNINFEDSAGNWSDGEYTERAINNILNLDKVITPEERLVKLVFKKLT